MPLSLTGRHPPPTYTPQKEPRDPAKPAHARHPPLDPTIRGNGKEKQKTAKLISGSRNPYDQ